MRATDLLDRKLSKGEEKEKERIVKGMKKAKGSFKDRYGKDAEAVMYATATKLAKENVDKDGTPMCPDACCGVPVSECTCGPKCPHCNCHFMKKIDKVLEYAFSKKDFMDNEAENLHSENAVEIAKKFGTPEEIKQMEDILSRHMKRGHITPEDMELRNAVVSKYYAKLESFSMRSIGLSGASKRSRAKDREDLDAKSKALQDIQKDKHTSKDPELQKALMKRKAEIEKKRKQAFGESEHSDIKTILDKHNVRSIDDIEYGSKAYEELFGYYMDSGEMPYGVMKARTGDPDQWIADRVSDLGLLEDGSSHTSMNKYGLSARNHKGKFYSYRHGKMTGVFDSMEELAKHQEELIKDESIDDEAGLQGSVTPQTISKEFPGVADKNNLVQALLKMKRGDKNYSRNQMIAAADAFKELLSKDPMETQKLMMMLKRIKAKEEVAVDINSKWKEYQK
jgi:hypothetical protein